MTPDETGEIETSTDATDYAATNDTNGDGSGQLATQRRPSARERRAEQEDSFPIQGIDYIEFYVGNAKQAAHFYRTAFGFNVIAYAGPETKVRDRASYVLEQNKIRFVLTAPLQPEGEIAAHVNLHGDGVKDIALRVPDVDYAYHTAVERGATGVTEPHWVESEKGRIRKAAIAAAGDTVHTFINRDDYAGTFAPGYHKRDIPGVPTGVAAVDHQVINVELGKMNYWVEYYARIMGFSQLISFDDKDISTEYSALMSKVMQDGTGRVKFPINEPAAGKKKSQIEEYLDYYRTPGVQHIALITGDIIGTVSKLRDNGVEFLRVPHSYYVEAPARVGQIKEDLAQLEELGILIDRDDEGYLLQIFTKPVQDRPTVFFEIIERHGSRGFGKGNFKALFEAIEREQELRGNL
ncbi:MAG: 4-hydroxyphenylpyruvate dioxygenase [Chloroflexota bacterium]|nr:4-hydroxyphenylpyruvate dioxygenase [Chloroflexota bacterium]MDQ5866700.1 4-hydroxyphenylpyruvate dioxygenase [Chloroflexota bacterium]